MSKKSKYEGFVIRHLTDSNGRVIVSEESCFKPSTLPTPWEQIKEFLEMFAERK